MALSGTCLHWVSGTCLHWVSGTCLHWVSGTCLHCHIVLVLLTRVFLAAYRQCNNSSPMYGPTMCQISVNVLKHIDPISIYTIIKISCSLRVSSFARISIRSHIQYIHCFINALYSSTSFLKFEKHI